MERIEAESLGDVLRRTIREAGIERNIDEARAMALFPSLVGPELAALMGKPFVKNGVMNICIRAASLRHEMHMRRSTLVRLINDDIGKPVIKDIRFF